MKVAYVNYSDISGGAARGAYRLHRGLLNAEINSRLFVRSRILSDPTVTEPGSELEKSLSLIKYYFSRNFLKLQKPEHPGLRNINLFGSSISREVSRFSPDIVQLHWIGYDSMGILELGKIRAPIVWRLADMWAFTGTEHYTSDDVNARFKSGYRSDNRSPGSRGLDLDRYIWTIKKRAWRGLPITFVTGSEWLASCVRESSLFKGYRVEVIPSGIDLNIFKPISKAVSRDIFGIPKGAKVIMFSAQNALQDGRKGFQYLYRSIRQGFKNSKEVVLAVIGHTGDPPIPSFDFPTFYLGQLWDDQSLALAYSAADVFVAPSTQDNLPFSVIEASACGVPVVAFSVGGLPEMIRHLKTGYLAQPFHIEDLTEGINWALENIGSDDIPNETRIFAQSRFSISDQVRRYRSLYESLL